jgi:hypothetical protein
MLNVITYNVMSQILLSHKSVLASSVTWEDGLFQREFGSCNQNLFGKRDGLAQSDHIK